MSRGNSKVLDRKWRGLLVVAVVTLGWLFTLVSVLPAAKVAKTDINSATQAELEAVKGMSPAIAPKIMENRPYKSLADLKKAGLSPQEIKEFKPYLTAKKPVAAAAPEAAPTAEPGTTKAAQAAQGAPETPVEVNTADPKALEALPGIGPALAQRIMAARPLKNLDELAKVKGMSKTKVAALKDRVTFGPAAPATPAASPATAPATPAAKIPATPAAKEKAKKPPLAPGEKINLNTASEADLDKLPEIGPAKAKAIMAGRPYQTTEEVMKVKGIKEGIYKKIKDHITVH